MSILNDTIFYLDALKAAVDNKRDLNDFMKRLNVILLEGQMDPETYKIIKKVVDLELVSNLKVGGDLKVGGELTREEPKPVVKAKETPKKREITPTTVDPCGIGSRSTTRFC